MAPAAAGAVAWLIGEMGSHEGVWVAEGLSEVFCMLLCGLPCVLVGCHFQRSRKLSEQ